MGNRYLYGNDQPERRIKYEGPQGTGYHPESRVAYDPACPRGFRGERPSVCRYRRSRRNVCGRQGEEQARQQEVVRARYGG